MLDADLCDLSAAAYTDAAAWSRGDVHATRRDLDAETTVVAFRGTCDVPTALRDARAWPSYDAALGWCHSGFLSGARSVAVAMASDLAGRRVIIGGHSLGGALAIITGAIFTLAGRPPVAVVTFGAPRAGFRKLRSVLRLVPVRQYRLGDDPVTEVPWLMGLFVHMRPLRQLEAPWSLDPFEDHHVDKYRRALKRTKTLTRAAIERPFS